MLGLKRANPMLSDGLDLNPIEDLSNQGPLDQQGL